MNDVLSSILSTGMSTVTPKLVVSSNLSPDITIDLAQMLKPGDTSQAISSEDQFILHLIRPEVIITGFGMRKSMAPYGRPYAGMVYVCIAGILITGLLGAAITWSICSKVGN